MTHSVLDPYMGGPFNSRVDSESQEAKPSGSDITAMGWSRTVVYCIFSHN